MPHQNTMKDGRPYPTALGPRPIFQTNPVQRGVDREAFVNLSLLIVLRMLNTFLDVYIYHLVDGIVDGLFDDN